MHHIIVFIIVFFSTRHLMRRMDAEMPPEFENMAKVTPSLVAAAAMVCSLLGEMFKHFIG